MELSKLIQTIADSLNVKPSMLNESTGPGEIEAWDSLGHLTVLNALEEKYDMTFDIDQVLRIETVKDILEIINGVSQTDKDVDMVSGQISKTASVIRVKAETSTQPLSKYLSSRVFRTVPHVTLGVGSLNSIQVPSNAKILLVTGRSNYANIIHSKINELIESTNSELFIVQKPEGEPTNQNIKSLINNISENFSNINSKDNLSKKLIISAGGGSVLDSAKLIRTKLQFKDDLLENWSKPFSLPQVDFPIPIIAIPTTHGSGAEVSSAAAWSPDNKGKQILLSHGFMSDQVFLDGNLCTGLPELITTSSTLDALTHLIEGYFSTLDHPLARPLAIPNIQLILTHLQTVLADPKDPQERQFLLEASYNAGVIQNHCSVGLVHSISHQFSRYGFNHGHLNGIFLIPVWRYTLGVMAASSKNFVQQLGYENIQVFLDEVESLIISCKLPKLSTNKISYEDNKADLLRDIRSDITFRTHPIKISDKDIDKIILDTIL